MIELALKSWSDTAIASSGWMYVKKVRIVQSNRIIREEIHQKEQYIIKGLNAASENCVREKEKMEERAVKKQWWKKGCLSDLSKKL